MGIIGALLRNPEDFPALLKLNVASVAASRDVPTDPNLAFCYQMLRRVSRSFSIVVQQLGPGLRNAVCVFYLVLQGLESIESDISLPFDMKESLLKDFHEKIYDPDFHFEYGRTDDYKLLMDKFYLVNLAFMGLAKGYQEVITEISERMGEGMVKFLDAEIETIADYNEHCHYVAGLVGLGLSRLFYASGTEQFAPDFLSNSMGLFLQKTSYVRDYLENMNVRPKVRPNWPREIWAKYVTQLEDLTDPKNSTVALHCLNEMITNALSHGTDCLQYMAALQEPSNLRFTAIPQIMAMGTLAMCYNNMQVFRGAVKIRKGLTAKILEVKNMQDVYGSFYEFTSIIANKIEKGDPSSLMTLKYVQEIHAVCQAELHTRRSFTIESKTGHEACLVAALLILLVSMLMIVWRQ